MRRSLIALAVLAATVPATSAVAAAPAAPLVGTRWVVDTFYDGPAAGPAPAGAEAHLTFSANDRVSGSGGCNALGGTAELGPRTIEFSGIITTMMACGEPRDTLEHAVKAVLNQGTVTYTLTNRSLALRGEERGMRLHAE